MEPFSVGGHEQAGDLAALHESLVSGDLEARNRAAAILLNIVVVRLSRRQPHLDPHLIHEAVEDAILNYLNDPRRYDPTRAALITFICMVAFRNVIDLLRKSTTRRRYENEVASLTSTIVNGRQDERSLVRLKSLYSQLARTDAERRFVTARANGERRIEVLALILDPGALMPDVQRINVKRMMDKLRIRAYRLKIRRKYRAQCRMAHTERE